MRPRCSATPSTLTVHTPTHANVPHHVMPGGAARRPPRKRCLCQLRCVDTRGEDADVGAVSGPAGARVARAYEAMFGKACTSAWSDGRGWQAGALTWAPPAVQPERELRVPTTPRLAGRAQAQRGILSKVGRKERLSGPQGRHQLFQSASAQSMWGACEETRKVCGVHARKVCGVHARKVCGVHARKVCGVHARKTTVNTRHEGAAFGAFANRAVAWLNRLFKPHSH
eukprot:364478-Chlamydomonas_euryale.AAC.3